MSVSESDRHHLYELARAAWDERAAAVLMTLIPPVGWVDVATRQDVAAMGQALRGEIAQLDGRLQLQFAELRGEFAELRGEFGGLRSEVRGELALLRGDIGLVEGRLREAIGELRGDLAAQTRTMVWSISALFLAGAAVAVGVGQLAG